MKRLLVVVCAWVGLVNLSAQDLPEMIHIPGGSFNMGSDQGERDEKPVHSVTVDAFWMAKTETTVKQWKAFCVSTGRPMPNAPWFGFSDDHPIVNISWDDAMAYCYWLRQKTAKEFRLPTEAEWEFAAGGPKRGSIAYSGNAIPDSVAWYAHHSNGTMPVAMKHPNELGLYDMSGNVWEWCSDWYDENYDKAVSKNPGGPASGKFKVLRGGAWDIGARNTRNSYRNPLAPSSRNHNKGFRVVYAK
jgi:formylglycine-generating enzyme required for sulfatase activity